MKSACHDSLLTEPKAKAAWLLSAPQVAPIPEVTGHRQEKQAKMEAGYPAVAVSMSQTLPCLVYHSPGGADGLWL